MHKETLSFLEEGIPLALFTHLTGAIDNGVDVLFVLDYFSTAPIACYGSAPGIPQGRLMQSSRLPRA